MRSPVARARLFDGLRPLPNALPSLVSPSAYASDVMNVLGALWVDASEAAGSIAAALGLLGGVAIAILYGRKATAQVAAEGYLANGSVLAQYRVLPSAPSGCSA